MQTNEVTLLIAQQDRQFSTHLALYLQSNGYRCVCVSTGDEVEPQLAKKQVDLLLIDSQITGKNGFDICRDVRKTSNIPIIILTADFEPSSELLGLNLGADDYIRRPCEMQVLEARVRANLRRTMRLAGEQSDDEWFKLKENELKMQIQGKDIMFTVLEWRLITTLYNHKRQVVSRSRLIEKIYDDNRIVTERTIDTLVKSVRKKIRSAEPERTFIHSIYGLGYKFDC